MSSIIWVSLIQWVKGLSSRYWGFQKKESSSRLKHRNPAWDSSLLPGRTRSKTATTLSSASSLSEYPTSFGFVNFHSLVNQFLKWISVSLFLYLCHITYRERERKRSPMGCISPENSNAHFIFSVNCHHQNPLFSILRLACIELVILFLYTRIVIISSVFPNQ